ncbi:hypothetical protein NDU88_003861 [Pleurodeles waltl]|uniref:Uncharacterized protein n=1 Tax=Pleurodeles waltl TaxID=8319 RepID=A0AAV7N1C6_PLEWA|nr:hypothetical protein NDU88_003861 [Pleurodeles waltl]
MFRSPLILLMANQYTLGLQHIRVEERSPSTAYRSPQAPVDSTFQSRILFCLLPRRGLPCSFLGPLGPNRSLASVADTARWAAPPPPGHVSLPCGGPQCSRT